MNTKNSLLNGITRFLMISILISCAKFDQPTSNVDVIKSELKVKIEYLKQNKSNLPSALQTIDDVYKKNVRLFYSQLNGLKEKSQDASEFYGKFSELIEKFDNQMYRKESNKIDETVVKTVGQFIISIFYAEIKENNYNFSETGLILENAILTNSLLEIGSKKVLSSFIAGVSCMLDELAKSGVLTTDSKITWDSFVSCLRSETDVIFSNPVKAIAFIIGIPTSWLWLNADCVYQTWNS